VRACKCSNLLSAVEQGLSVLTSSGTVLRRGFTTGTTAAAACKAAVLSLEREVHEVAVTMPCGITVTLPVSANRGAASCIKDAGDYADDITAGIEIAAHAMKAQSGIRIVHGEGVGTFIRDTPRYRREAPAISPPALQCILRSIEEAIHESGIPGATVILSIPMGAALAQRTLNPAMGISGGISVLGTTGLVEPWDDHVGEAVLDRIARSEHVVMTTGRIGLRYARLLFPDHEAVLVGNRLGPALRQARGDVVLCGLPGQILRLINTGVLTGTGFPLVHELAASTASG